MKLKRDEFGFLRSSGYENVSASDLRVLLDAREDDEIYRSTRREGVRIAEPVDEEIIKTKPTDRFGLGPKVTKAAAAIPRQIQREYQALKRAGYGQVKPPRAERFGYVIPLSGFVLPGGRRTEAMILLPSEYPTCPPIGFYVSRRGVDAAKDAGLDVEHLFPTTTYHGAPNLSSEGWLWFCTVFEHWKPHHHNLVGVMLMVAAMLAEGGVQQ